MLVVCSKYESPGTDATSNLFTIEKMRPFMFFVKKKLNLLTATFNL